MNQPPERAVSVELTETARGEWLLRIVGDISAAEALDGDSVTAQVKVTPNLLPGEPFPATVQWRTSTPVAD